MSLSRCPFVTEYLTRQNGRPFGASTDTRKKNPQHKHAEFINQPCLKNSTVSFRLVGKMIHFEWLQRKCTTNWRKCGVMVFLPEVIGAAGKKRTILLHKKSAMNWRKMCLFLSFFFWAFASVGHFTDSAWLRNELSWLSFRTWWLEHRKAQKGYGPGVVGFLNTGISTSCEVLQSVLRTARPLLTHTHTSTCAHTHTHTRTHTRTHTCEHRQDGKTHTETQAHMLWYPIFYDIISNYIILILRVSQQQNANQPGLKG